jgi:hypothetical protein
MVLYYNHNQNNGGKMIIERIDREKEINTEIDRIDISVNGVRFTIKQTVDNLLSVSTDGDNIMVFPAYGNSINIKGDKW